MSLNNPEYVKVGDKKYKINTDYRVAIKCNNIAIDDEINDLERVKAIIYLLYGEEGLKSTLDYEKLLELGFRYLACGQELKPTNEEPDMDFEQDMPYIKASFRSDYNIDLNKESIHWWEFNNLLNGLSNSEMGNCCVLNRIRNIRNLDLSKIEDKEEKEKLKKAKESVMLKKKKKNLTDREKQNIEEFNKLAGISGKE